MDLQVMHYLRSPLRIWTRRIRCARREPDCVVVPRGQARLKCASFVLLIWTT